jgi:5-methylcytosine-specific restriction endonuclease McrA
MPECSIEGCTNRLTTRNETGRCREKHHAKYWVASVCGGENCTQVLHADNRTGFCHEHRGQAEAHQAYLRAYYQSRKAEFREYARNWRLANGDDSRAAARAWNRANPEARQAMHARRRTRVKADMSAADRRESVERRKQIKSDPCYYCGTAETSDTDHFFPLAKGGTDHWWNLVRACDLCNSRKNATCGTAFMLRTGRLT